MLQNDLLLIVLKISFEINKIKMYRVQCQVPEKKNLKTFVSRPPTEGLRLYCTMIR